MKLFKLQIRNLFYFLMQCMSNLCLTLSQHIIWFTSLLAVSRDTGEMWAMPCIRNTTCYSKFISWGKITETLQSSLCFSPGTKLSSFPNLKVNWVSWFAQYLKTNKWLSNKVGGLIQQVNTWKGISCSRQCLHICMEFMGSLTSNKILKPSACDISQLIPGFAKSENWDNYWKIKVMIWGGLEVDVFEGQRQIM